MQLSDDARSVIQRFWREVADPNWKKRNPWSMVSHQLGQAMDRSVDLSVVVVNWNSCEELRACLGSVISQSEHAQLEIIVVDNASDDGSLGMLRREFPRVVVVESEANLGFARAVNQGLRLIRSRHVVLLNPDSVVLDRALGRMVDFLDSHPCVGAVGPRIICSTGGPDYAHSPKRFPTLWDDLLKVARIRPRGYHRPDLSDPSVLKDGQVVDALPGTCLMVRREALAKVGELDEQFFLFGEDVDWCLRLWQAGWEVRWWPRVTVRHGHIERSSAEWPRITMEGVVARDQLYRKHRPRVCVQGHRLLVGMGAIVKLTIWFVLSGLPSGNPTWRRSCQQHRALHAGILRWALGRG